MEHVLDVLLGSNSRMFYESSNTQLASLDPLRVPDVDGAIANKAKKGVVLNLAMLNLGL